MLDEGLPLLDWLGLSLAPLFLRNITKLSISRTGPMASLAA
jgi:hypothetical protein